MSAVLQVLRRRSVFSLPASVSDALADRRVLEVGAVVVTSVGHLALTQTPPLHFAFVLFAITGWLLYVRHRGEEGLREWGLTRDNLGPSFVANTAFFVVAALGVVGIGLLMGSSIPATILIPLAFYPLWGLVQQLLVQGMVAGNLEKSGVPAWVIVPVTAALFGLVHWPYPALMIATFGLGLVFTPLFLRYRNLWALGLYHGWLGTLFYYLVLQRDPVAEVALPWLEALL